MSPSPFKEPQPRKQPTDKANGFPPVVDIDASKIKFPPPGLEDLGELPQPQPPLTVLTELDVAIRTSALQAAVALHGNSRDNSVFWDNISTLEHYLRTGGKP